MQGRPDLRDRQTARLNDDRWRQSISSQQPLHPIPRPMGPSTAGGDWSSYQQRLPDMSSQLRSGMFVHQTTGPAPPELGLNGAFLHPLSHQGGPPNHWPLYSPNQQAPRYHQPPEMVINQMADQTLIGMGPGFDPRPGGSFAPRSYPPPTYRNSSEIGGKQLGQEGILPTPVPGTYDSTSSWQANPPPASAQLMHAAPRAVRPLARVLNGGARSQGHGFEGRNGEGLLSFCCFQMVPRVC